MRRILDLLILLLISPIVIIIFPLLTILKYTADGFPIFYISMRVGKNSIPFRVYKFRTMVNDRYFINSEIEKYKDGFEVIPLNSAVYTRIGRAFEKFQFVEIPQLINILKNEMSFIGYRPLPIEHIKALEKVTNPELIFLRHQGIPGLTGFTQLIGKKNIDKNNRIQVEINESIFFSKYSIKTFFVYVCILVLTIPVILGLINSQVVQKIYDKYVTL